jgi:hypothetical protein
MKILKQTVLGSFLLLLTWSCVPRDYHEYICFHCRCGHTKGGVLGLPYETFAPTALTRWYAGVFPGHVHQWLHTGHYRTQPLGGMVCSSVGGSLTATNPFWNLKEEEQLDFLKSATGVELYRLTSLLAEHQQRDAVDLVLGKQTPPRVLCDNFAGWDRPCPVTIVGRDQAIPVGKGDEALYFCSELCRNNYRQRP